MYYQVGHDALVGCGVVAFIILCVQYGPALSVCVKSALNVLITIKYVDKIF